MAAFQPLITGETGRATRIRLVAAAMLQRKGRKEEAAALLTGRDPVIRAAHAMIQGGKRLRTGIATPAEGMAELFVRLAADAGRDHTSQAGLVIARLATFLAPQNRSEEHTSELQSLMRISYAVFCLKKKNQTIHRCNH